MARSPRRIAGRLGLDQLAPAQTAYRGIESGRLFARGYRYGSHLPEPSGVPTTRQSEPSSLQAYAVAHTNGPGIFKWQHYFDIYDRHLGRFRGRAVRVVEIGVAGGGSLGMWRDYLGPDATICGIDIEPQCRRFQSEGIEIVIGDQGSSTFWRGFLQHQPPIDILIDDGSHLPEHQVTTLECVLPHIQPGGVYICEDIHGALQPFHGYLDGLSRPLNDISVGGQTTAANGLQRHIASVHRYPIMAVIEKATCVPDQFACRRYGSEWPEDWTGLR